MRQPLDIPGVQIFLRFSIARRLDREVKKLGYKVKRNVSSDFASLSLSLTSIRTTGKTSKLLAPESSSNHSDPEASYPFAPNANQRRGKSNCPSGRLAAH